jgi:hypothetical protein
VGDFRVGESQTETRGEDVALELPDGTGVGRRWP